MKKTALCCVAVYLLGILNAFSAVAQDKTLADIAEKLTAEQRVEEERREQKRQERRIRAQKIVKDDIVIIPDYWANDGKTEEVSVAEEIEMSADLAEKEQVSALKDAYEKGVDVADPFAVCIVGKPCSACDAVAPLWDGIRCVAIPVLSVPVVSEVAVPEKSAVVPPPEQVKKEDATSEPELIEPRLKSKPIVADGYVEPKKSRLQIQKEKQRARIQARKEARQKRHSAEKN